MNLNFAELAAQHLQALRTNAPLVLNVTNLVVMNTTANALLAIGALPIMAHAEGELEEMTELASALALNIGTLDAAWIRSMQLALDGANKQDIPVLIDPVGAGATRLRLETALSLIRQTKNLIIRGNASEIIALGNATKSGKGVDSTEDSTNAVPSALALSSLYKCVVCISGEHDYVVNPEGVVARIKGGSPLMPKVTGMGCTATALMAAFATIAESPFLAAIGTMTTMATAGTIAAHKAQGPGTFLPYFLDALYTMQPRDIFTHARVKVLSKYSQKRE